MSRYPETATPVGSIWRIKSCSNRSGKNRTITVTTERDDYGYQVVKNMWTGKSRPIMKKSISGGYVRIDPDAPKVKAQEPARNESDSRAQFVRFESILSSMNARIDSIDSRLETIEVLLAVIDERSARGAEA